MSIFLHIGGAKAGSTAIQKFLHKNKSLMESKGYHYLKYSRKDSHELALALGFGVLPKRRLFPKVKFNKQEILNQTIDAIKSHDNCIISSEVLSISPKKNEIDTLKNIIKGQEIKVLFYLRNPIEQTESAYKQLLKNGISENPTEFAKKHNPKFKKVIQLYANAFGDENIEVRPYTKSSFKKGNIFSDILNFINNNWELRKFSTPSNYETNTSISSIQAEVIRLCNEGGFTNNEDLIKHIAAVPMHQRLNEKLFTVDEQKEIQESYEEDLNWVSKTFWEGKTYFQNEISTDYEYFSEIKLDSFTELFMAILQEKHMVLKPLFQD